MEQMAGSGMPVATRAGCTSADGAVSMEQAEGSGLPVTTRDGDTPADDTAVEKAFPIEERLRHPERHK